MSDGFLGNRATFMLDTVVCALILVVPLLAYSIYTVKASRKYRRHRNLQLMIATILLITVVAFEVDLQWIHKGWRSVVAKRAPALSEQQFDFVHKLLRIHLIFAVSTPVLWLTTIGLGLRRFPRPPIPSEHSALHKKLGWLSAIDLALTSATGLVFYYFAFVA